MDNTQKQILYDDKPIVFASTAGNNIIYDVGDYYHLHIVSKNLSAKFDKLSKPLDRIVGIIIQRGDFTVINDNQLAISRKDSDGKTIFMPLTRVLYAVYRKKQYSRLGKGRIYFAENPTGNVVDYSSNNLYRSGDSVEYTPARRVYSCGDRIYIKLKNHSQRFFTEYEPDLLKLLQSHRLQWYVDTRERKHKLSYSNLYASIMKNGKVTFKGNRVPLAGIIYAYHHLGLTSTNIMKPLRKLCKLYNIGFVIDHLRDNPHNNCIHNLVLMKDGQNTRKYDRITRINAPYYFIPVSTGGEIRVCCGKVQENTGWNEYYCAETTEDFLNLLEMFYKYAISCGDMQKKPEEKEKTTCISQLLQDDGTDLAIQGLLSADYKPIIYHMGDVLTFQNAKLKSCKNHNIKND